MISEADSPQGLLRRTVSSSLWVRAGLAAMVVAWAGLPSAAGSLRPSAMPSVRPSPWPIEPLWLKPGTPTGAVTTYQVKRGDYLNDLGVQFKINPIRITKPNGRDLKNGMRVGQVIKVDLRRVTPVFDRSVSGVVLNLPEAHVYLVERGRLLKDYAVGVSNADRKAPIGSSRIVSLVRNPAWYVPNSIQKEMADQGREVKRMVPPGPDNPLGSRWIGFADGTFGFHGTTLPWSIKRYASHGCARFLREDIEDLFSRVRLGMRVRVIYQPVTLAVQGRSVWASIYPDYYNLGYDHRAAVFALAKQAKVAHLIQEATLQQALRDQDGMLVDLAALPPTPAPTPTPVPTATPRPVLPSEQPVASPVMTPSPAWTSPPVLQPSPSAQPSASPVPYLRPPGFPAFPPASPPPLSNPGS